MGGVVKTPGLPVYPVYSESPGWIIKSPGFLEFPEPFKYPDFPKSFEYPDFPEPKCPESPELGSVAEFKSVPENPVLLPAWQNLNHLC